MLVYLCLMVIMIPLERITLKISSFSISVAGHTFKYVPHGLLLWGILLILRYRNFNKQKTGQAKRTVISRYRNFNKQKTGKAKRAVICRQTETGQAKRAVILKRKKRPHFRRTPLDLPILVYLSFCLISLFTSCDVKASSEEFMHILVFFLWFYLVVNHIKKEREINWLLLSLLAGSIWISIYGIHHFFILGRRAVGLGKNLRLGVYFAMTLPIILGQSLWRGPGWWRVTFGCGALLMLITAPLTLARGPWIGLLGAMLFLGFLWDKRVLLILLAILLILPFVAPKIIKSRAASIINPPITQKRRIADWQTALRMTEDFPLTGVGLGRAYLTAYPRYRPGCGYYYCHNLYLHQAASVGIPGLVAYIWLIITFFRKGFRSLARKRWFFSRTESEPRKDLLAGILAGIFGILIASLTDEHFHATEVAMTFWFLVGLGIVLSRLISDKAKQEIIS